MAEEREELQVRVHEGGAGAPTLIYLPGMHGDWTLIGGFRRALDGRARFVEFTYPRTTEWSLDDYAAAVETALAARGIAGGWLVGESFGSQVVWAVVARGRFQFAGIILAGGFARHPLRRAVRLAERIFGGLPLAWFTWILFSYSKVARFRFRRSPETMASLNEFIERRTEQDRRAGQHRLRLVAGSDPTETARRVTAPVYALSGVLDPIVPWFLTRPGLRRCCPALRAYRVVWSADHNVLSTAPQVSAEQVLRWVAGNSDGQ